MTSYSKSFSEVDLAIRLPPPPRLVRTFRTDFRPIPYFLQDLLAEVPCRSCSDNQSRIIDLLKNIQTYGIIDCGSEGRLWFEICRILRKGVMADTHIFNDGRQIRNHLAKQTQPKDLATFGRPEFLDPLSPFTRHNFRIGKFENLLHPPPSTLLILTRQVSG